MTTATQTPTRPVRSCILPATRQGVWTETHWNEAANKNWMRLHRNNVELVAFVATDRVSPWHTYAQRDQAGPMVAMNHFATADAAMDAFERLDGEYPSKAHEWHPAGADIYNRQNMGGDLLLITRNIKLKRPFRCYFTKNLGRGRRGQMTLLHEAYTLELAMAWFDRHPAG